MKYINIWNILYINCVRNILYINSVSNISYYKLCKKYIEYSYWMKYIVYKLCKKYIVYSYWMKYFVYKLCKKYIVYSYWMKYINPCSSLGTWRSGPSPVKNILLFSGNISNNKYFRVICCFKVNDLAVQTIKVLIACMLKYDL